MTSSDKQCLPDITETQTDEITDAMKPDKKT